MKNSDYKAACQAYAEAAYLTEKENIGKALNDIDEWIEAIYENPEYNREDVGVMELVQKLYLHKAKIYGRIDHYTESQKALAMAGYPYYGEMLSERILTYISEIEKKLQKSNGV